MLKIDKTRTATFDVDPQCGFTPLCPKELPVLDGDKIAEALNVQSIFGRIRVVSKDTHPAEAPWVAETTAEIMTPVIGDYPDLDIKWPRHCVQGTYGNQLMPGLPAEEHYDIIIKKGMDPHKHPYGACYHGLDSSESTGVIEKLREENIDTIIIGGLATDYCVVNTALQLKAAGFRVIVNLAACRGVAPETTKAAIQLMTNSENNIEVIQNLEHLRFQAEGK